MKISHVFAASAIALASLSANAATEFVSNGSFEANVQAANSWAIYDDLSGWTGLVSGIELRNNVSGAAQQGSNFVELDTDMNSGMAQSINASGKVLLSFWYSARPGTAAGTNDIKVKLGSFSAIVLNGVGNASNANNWQHFTQVVDLGTKPSSVLAFYSLGSSDGYGGALDNISVTAVPEPETYAMLLAGLGLMGCIARRRKQSKAA